MSETSPTAAGATWSYRTGPWFAVFGPRVTVLLPESQRDRVVALWSLVDGGADFDEVLDGLLASGLSRLPGFVLVSTDDGPTRVLLRGAGVRATLEAGEEVVLDGSAGATWVERSVEGVTALTVVVTDEENDAPSLPILAGLVRVARIDRPPVAGPAGVAEASAASASATAAPATDATSGGDPMAPVAVGPVGPGDLSSPIGDAAGAAGDTADVPLAEEPVAEEPAADVPLAEEPLAEEPVAEDGPWAEPAVDPAAVADMVDSEPVPADEAAIREEPVAEGEQPIVEEPEPAWSADDATAAENDTAPTDVLAVGDPLTDPLPPQDAAPDGWVTPWSDVPVEPTDAPAEEAEEPEGPPPAPEGLPPVPEGLPPVPDGPPPPYAPPPPPSEPPLGIGSWEPVGGFPPPPPAPADSDHDGLTVAGGSEPPPPPPGIPGQPPAPPVTSQPVAKLLVSDGQTILVDRAVLIGRAPEARRFSSSDQPLLVTVPSRLHEISSTHIEVRPGTGADLGGAVVTDMGSTNGTVLVQPGLGPEDLKPGIAVQLIPGAIINLGDGITIQVTRP